MKERPTRLRVVKTHDQEAEGRFHPLTHMGAQGVKAGKDKEKKLELGKMAKVLPECSKRRKTYRP